MIRGTAILVRLTAEERQALKRLAARERSTVSQVIRRTLLGPDCNAGKDRADTPGPPEQEAVT